MENTENKIKRLEKIVYPYYGIDESLNQIILFVAPNTGMNINGKGWSMGKYSDGWDEKSFMPYYGQITIVNGRILEFTDNKNSINKWEQR